ncbi:hypothetical protein GCM10023257_49000 [Streptomyces hyderabadensis]|uniref:Uncharacterized protein n=1 Tax=Streptomyces hyderabadensis TaxID=598549 RepID=A0ABP9IJ80_9ACTN
MPEPTPNLHGANTALHKEVRNQPERRGRTVRNAPSTHPDASGHGHDGAGRDDLGERPDRGVGANGAAGRTAVRARGVERGRRTTGVRHLTPPKAGTGRVNSPAGGAV